MVACAKAHKRMCIPRLCQCTNNYYASKCGIHPPFALVVVLGCSIATGQILKQRVQRPAEYQCAAVVGVRGVALHHDQRHALDRGTVPVLVPLQAAALDTAAADSSQKGSHSHKATVLHAGKLPKTAA